MPALGEATLVAIAAVEPDALRVFDPHVRGAYPRFVDAGLQGQPVRLWIVLENVRHLLSEETGAVPE